MNFKVLFGVHSHIDKKRYKAGDIIQTDMPLDKIFHGKFLRIDASTQKVNDIQTFSPPVEIIEDVVGVGPVPDETTIPDVENEKPVVVPPRRAHGVNKTELFPEAVEQDFQVFLINRKYDIYDNDTGQKINPERLGKRQVAYFIKEYLAK